MRTSIALLPSLVLALAAAGEARAADWPQFMHDAAHTGDAADEALALPLGLVAQIKLDDAILGAPALVGGRAYVVDQLGTAYCLDVRAGRILWKSSPDGESSCGSNTSSPCVVNGRVCYGTTAGNFHILDAADGKVVKTVKLGWPMLSSPTWANDRVYFQALDAVVRCYDLDGNEKWQWDHYKRYTKPPPPEKVAWDRPHYGGGEVAVSGKFLVTKAGWDHFCLEDKGREAALAWCNRAPLGRDVGVPGSASIFGGYAYTAWPGVDFSGSLLRVPIKDGALEKCTLSGRPDQDKNYYGSAWAILGTPAVRGSTAYFGLHSMGAFAVELGLASYQDTQRGGPNPLRWRYGQPSPVLSSPVLTKEHCLFTTALGELLAVPLAAKGYQHQPAFRFRTPHGMVITSTPAVAGGLVAFGCDDGYLYVLGPGGGLQPKKDEKPGFPESRSKVRPATGKAYDWPSGYGEPGNSRYVDDPGLKPPFRLRWAVRDFGVYTPPGCAVEQDLVLTTVDGMVSCLEQETGRLRWRIWLRSGHPPRLRTRTGMCSPVAANGRIYIPHASHTADAEARLLYCLEKATGRTLWTVKLGWPGFAASCKGVKNPALLAGGRVIFSSLQCEDAGKRYRPVAEAWEAETGKPAWRVEFGKPWAGGNPDVFSPVGCALGDTVFFSCGGYSGKYMASGPEDREGGETVAIEARTGKVLWRTSEAWTTSAATLVARDGRVFVAHNARLSYIACLDAGSGKTLWKSKDRDNDLSMYAPTVAPEFLVVKGKEFSSVRLDIKTGQEQPFLRPAVEYTCSAPVLTSGGLMLTSAVQGLTVRSSQDGSLLWQSPGFAPRNCASPAVANGRVFVTPQISNTLYCFEPEGSPALPRGERPGVPGQ